MRTKSRWSGWRVAVVGMALVVALSAGCVTQTIHPLYTRETLLFDERLVGTWSDGSVRWTFEPAQGRAYDLTIVEDGGEGATISMTAHLVHLHGALFLDLAVEDLEEGEPGFLYALFLMPVHTILRVDRIDDTLKTSTLDLEWLQEQVRTSPELMGTTFQEGRVLMSADTGALQAFFSAQRGNDAAWDEAFEMERRER